MKIYTIPQKMSNTGTIHDIASDLYERDIKFPRGSKYAVVTAAHYGGRGYTTHRSEVAAIRAAKRLGDLSYEIIDTDGTEYIVCNKNFDPCLIEKC